MLPACDWKGPCSPFTRNNTADAPETFDIWRLPRNEKSYKADTVRSEALRAASCEGRAGATGTTEHRNVTWFDTQGDVSIADSRRSYADGERFNRKRKRLSGKRNYFLHEYGNDASGTLYYMEAELIAQGRLEPARPCHGYRVVSTGWKDFLAVRTQSDCRALSFLAGQKHGNSAGLAFSSQESAPILDDMA